MAYFFTKPTIYAILRLFVRKVDGLENLPKKRAFVLVANHESYLDPFLIGSVIIPYLDKVIHFLALRTGLGVRTSEFIAKKWACCIFLEKGKEKEAIEECISCLKKKEIIGLFPGGITSARLRRGKTGAVRIALRAKVPIVPLGLIGTYKIAPKERRVPSLRRCVIKIGKPIYFDKYYSKKITKALLRRLTDSVMIEVAKLIGKKYLYMKH